MTSQSDQHAEGATTSNPLDLELGQSDGPAPEPRGRRRASSFTGLITKFLPSNRPERGGTARVHGYWEQATDDKHPTIYTEELQRPPAMEAAGRSSDLLEWNTPRELPRRAQTTGGPRAKRPASASAGDRIKKGDSPTRRLSWSPKKQSRDEVARTRPGPPAQRARPRVEVTRPKPPGFSPKKRTPPEEQLQLQTRAQVLFESKREARRLRRSLKESGDYLGVQGVNPNTGELDIVTPTSSSGSAMSPRTAHRLDDLSQLVRDTKDAYGEAMKQRELELRLARSKKEQDKLEKLEQEKASLRALQRRVRWKKDEGQWSSVAEPNLSPIAQSYRSGTSTSERHNSSPDSQTRRKPVPDRSPAKDPPLVNLQQSLSSAPVEEGQPGSSETIIHTPRGRGQSHISPSALDLYANGISISLPEKGRDKGKEIIEVVTKPSHGDKTIPLGEISSPGAPGMKGPTVELNPPRSMKHHTQPEFMNADQSFLGIQPTGNTDSGGSQSRYIATAATSPPKPVMNTADLPQNIRRPFLLKPRPLVRRPGNSDIPRGENMTGAGLRNHSAISRPYEQRNFSMPSQPSDVLSVLSSRPGSIMLQSPPSIPQRGTSLRDIDPSTPLLEKLIEVDPDTPTTRPRNISHPAATNLARIPSYRLVGETAGTWADTLIQNIDILSRGREMDTRSASTLTTTTTGSDLIQLSPGRGSNRRIEEPVDIKEDQATPKLTETSCKRPLLSIKGIFPPSPPKPTRRASPSDDPDPTTPAADTTSMRQLTHTKMRTEKLFHKASRGRTGYVEPPQDEQRDASTSTSPITTASSHCSPSASPLTKMTESASESRGPETMAQEAAQLAFVHAKIVEIPRNRQLVRGNKVKEVGNDNSPQKDNCNISKCMGGKDATAGRSRSDEAGARGLLGRDDLTLAAAAGRKGAMLLFRLLWAYWVLVCPVFNAESPLRRRLTARRLTWTDCGIYGLAAVFLLLAFWAYKLGIGAGALALQLVKALVKAFAVLVGI